MMEAGKTAAMMVAIWATFEALKYFLGLGATLTVAMSVLSCALGVFWEAGREKPTKPPTTAAQSPDAPRHPDARNPE